MKWEDPATVVPVSGAGGISSQVSDENQELRDDIRSEMIKLDSLIIRIDSLINSARTPADSDIEEITETMEELEKRKEELAGQQQ
jgi:protein involved in polysaccharide export with SLBB domain